MQPAASPAALNIYSEFIRLIPVQLSREASLQWRGWLVKQAKPELQPMIAAVFDLCMQARAESWADVEPRVRQARTIFEEKSGFSQLISCVSLNALYAGKCNEQQAQALAKDFITNNLESETPASLDFLKHFQPPLRSKIVQAIVYCLATYPDLHLFELAAEGFNNLFTIWKEFVSQVDKNDRAQLSVCFSALIQFPEKCWKGLSLEEKQIFSTFVSEYQKSLKGAEKGRMESQPIPQSKEWTARLATLRHLGCVYLLGRFLKVWNSSIDSVFPRYTQYLTVASSVYVKRDQITHSHCSFITRLNRAISRLPNHREHQLLTALYNFFDIACYQQPSHTTKLDLKASFIFLSNWDFLRPLFPIEYHADWEALNDNIFEELGKEGVVAAKGFVPLLTTFLESNPNIVQLAIFFDALENELSYRLPQMDVVIQEMVADALIKLLDENDEHAVAFKLLCSLPPHLPSYPQILCTRIELIYSYHGYKAITGLLIQAQNLLEELRVQRAMRDLLEQQDKTAPETILNNAILKENITALEKVLVDASEWENEPEEEQTIAP